MRTVALAVVLLSVTAFPAAWACNDPAHLRQMKRQTEAMEDSAKALERQNRELRAQNKLLGQKIRAQR